MDVRDPCYRAVSWPQPLRTRCPRVLSDYIGKPLMQRVLICSPLCKSYLRPVLVCECILCRWLLRRAKPTFRKYRKTCIPPFGLCGWECPEDYFSILRESVSFPLNYGRGNCSGNRKSTCDI